MLVLEQFTAVYPAGIPDLEQLYVLIHQAFERRNSETFFWVLVGFFFRGICMLQSISYLVYARDLIEQVQHLAGFRCMPQSQTEEQLTVVNI